MTISRKVLEAFTRVNHDFDELPTLESKDLNTIIVAVEDDLGVTFQLFLNDSISPEVYDTGRKAVTSAERQGVVFDQAEVDKFISFTRGR